MVWWIYQGSIQFTINIYRCSNIGWYIHTFCRIVLWTGGFYQSLTQSSSSPELNRICVCTFKSQDCSLKCWVFARVTRSSSPERANTIQMSTKASLSNWYLSSYLYLYYLYFYLNLYLSLYLNLCTLYVWLNHHHHRESTLFMCQRRQFSQTGIWTLTQLRRLTLLGFAQWPISKFCLTNNKTPKPFFCLLQKS